MPTLKDVLISVWWQALVEEAASAKIEAETIPGKEHAAPGLKTDRFSFQREEPARAGTESGDEIAMGRDGTKLATAGASLQEVNRRFLN